MLKHGIVGVLSTLLMVNWAVLLSVYTFEIQYSCKPLIEASTCIPCAQANPPQYFWQRTHFFVQAENQPPCPGNDSSSGDDRSGVSSKDGSKGGSGSDGKDEPKTPIIEPDTLIKGSVVGSVVAIGAVVVGAPAIVAIGVGVAVWLTASALLSSGS
ncbi:hypothetical protein H6G13_26830 [Pseudanabaena sp. FACHB-2040]|nr:hypothetical protein [Pseudanabaena sp. FACHB-2040]